MKMPTCAISFASLSHFLLFSVSFIIKTRFFSFLCLATGLVLNIRLSRVVEEIREVTLSVP
jgi:GTP cyclohydrolase III